MSSYHHIRKRRLDWWTIAVYCLLVFFGWLSIYSSTYSGEDAHFYDLEYRYGMQLVWIAIGVAFGIVILFLDVKIFFNFSFIFYGVGLLLMLMAIFLGKEINGAHSWIAIGPVSFQPVEFMKIGTAILLARIVDMYNGIINTRAAIIRFSIVLLIPVLFALLQNDAGSALVFFIFFVVLYREGISSSIYIIIATIVFVAVLSFVIEKEVLFFIIFIFTILFYAGAKKCWKAATRYIAISIIAIIGMSIMFVSMDVKHPVIISISIMGIISIAVAFSHSYYYNKTKPWMFAIIFIGLTSLNFGIDTVFTLLKPHQQERILDIFGISTDPRGISYNVNQSKIAIGSGGLSGRGFLQGTQTQYSFVPEQETDFIFCTVGEEEGFLGTSALIILFTILVVRLMQMGERAPNSFNRVYCYCVAGVFFFHFVINISMTIGLFPVIGIPLPFFSYGGSSFVCFTILLFIAIRMDLGHNLDNFM